MQEAVLRKSRTNDRDQEFCEVVIDGLSGAQKKLHPKYFYDQKGSQYFDEICQLEEYYPYQAETKLLPKVASQLAGILTHEYAMIEFGAGSLQKVRPVLDQIQGIKRFIPIDISGDHLRASSALLSQEFPDVSVDPVEGDFSKPIDLGEIQERKLGFFPGSTIGNFTPDEATKFLHNARQTLGQNSYLLVGVDTKKSPATLHSAYNDAAGVTAKFNLNILDRINQEFDSPMSPEKFEHYAYFNAEKGCIEMHLVCLEAHTVYLDDIRVEFSQGESIHTESSYKYSCEEFGALAQQSGWSIERTWLADQNLFSVYLLKADKA